MKTVNIQEAKTHLSRLVAEVENGETIVIGKAGTPVAMLTKWQPAIASRKGGGWAGKAWIAPDFDDPDREIEALFFGSGDGALQPMALVAEDPPSL